MHRSVNIVTVILLITINLSWAWPPTLERLTTPAAASVIDALRQRYLSLEKSLWHVVDGGFENSYALQQVHSGHRTFLTENFYEKGAYLSILDHEQRPIFDCINRINVSVSDTLRSYLRTSPRYYNEADAITSARLNANLTYHLDLIFNTTGATDFYKVIRNKAELRLCENGVSLIKSASQQVYEYYHDISVAELKAYALVQLAYMFYTIYGRGNYRQSATDLRTKYLQRTTRVQEQVKALLETANRDVWKCDPDDWSIGLYEEVTRLLQGYIDNEVNLNPENNCKRTCTDYKQTLHHVCRNDTYCALPEPGKGRIERICKGTVVDCQFFGSDMNICPSAEGTRRYNYIQYDNGRVLGNSKVLENGKCDLSKGRTESWTRWFVHCSNCFCLCDDPENSERHFSLHDVVSNIHKNKVVTGVALKKYLGVFHFLITEQELGTYGTINTSFPMWAAWNRNENFYINDPQIRDGIDYHTLNWQNRSVNLDVIEVPQGKVVTGLRFRVVDGALTLQVRGTEFDFITGRLQNLENSFWYASNAKDRIEIKLDEPSIPTKTEIKSIPDLRNNQYIKFQPSDVQKDIAQTTVPFIDAQLVQPAPNLVPLSGIGLYYKGFPKNGGFIAPKLLTYNYAPHIVAPLDN